MKKQAQNVSRKAGLQETQGTMGELTVLQILRVADLLTRIGDAKVFERDLTQAQFNVLMVLKRFGADGMSQKEIVELLVSTKGNISMHIGNLARGGYIRKKISREDSRRHVITLAPKGKRALAELEPRYVKHLKEITDDLPRQQTEATMAVLDILHAKCSATLNGANGSGEGEGGS